MTLYDLTRPLSPALPIYPGDPPLTIEPVERIAEGSKANVTRIAMGTHTGTHVDAPRHFFDSGAAIDELSLELLIGPARVLEIEADSAVDADALDGLVRGDERVLLKTRNSLLWQSPRFESDYVHLTEPAARRLLDHGVKLVGIDYLSIEAFGGDDTPVHNLLLGNGVVIVEGLDMAGVPAGLYELICLPILLMSGDGAAARVVLRSR
jgi:arylformamidase